MSCAALAFAGLAFAAGCERGEAERALSVTTGTPKAQPLARSAPDVWQAGPLPRSALHEPQRTGRFGSSHPFELLAMDPEGDWVALCQARRDTDGNGTISSYSGMHGEVVGDRMTPYLVWGGGEGEELEKFVDSDPSGRWVVVRSLAGRLELRDLRQGVARALPQPDGQDAAAATPWTLSFGKAGRFLLLLRPSSASDPEAALGVLDLNTLGLRWLSLGKAVVAFAQLSPDERWVETQLAREDTNHSGSLDLATVESNRSPDPCGSAASWSSRTTSEGDQLSTVIVPTRLHLAPRAVTLQGWIGPRAAIQREDASVALLDDEGHEEQLFGPKCDGQLRLYSPEDHRGLVACRDAVFARDRVKAPRGRSAAFLTSGPSLFEFEPGSSEFRALGIQQADDVLYQPEEGRYTEVSDGHALYDARARRLLALPQGFTSCQRHDDTFLLQKENRSTFIWRPGEQPQHVSDEPCWAAKFFDRRLLIGDDVFDWERRERIGSFVEPRHYGGLTRDGKSLVELSTKWLGPLVWATPTLATGATPKRRVPTSLE